MVFSFLVSLEQIFGESQAFFPLSWRIALPRHSHDNPINQFTEGIAVKAYVLGNAQRPGVVAEVEARLPFLREQVECLLVDLRQEIDLTPLPCADLALVFGGDGAILRGPADGLSPGSRARHQPRPARLSCRYPSPGFRTLLHASCAAEFLRHPAPHVRMRHRDRGPATQTYLGLNEVVIHAMPPRRMLDLELAVDGGGVALQRRWADRQLAHRFDSP